MERKDLDPFYFWFLGEFCLLGLYLSVIVPQTIMPEVIAVGGSTQLLFACAATTAFFGFLLSIVVGSFARKSRWGIVLMTITLIVVVSLGTWVSYILSTRGTPTPTLSPSPTPTSPVTVILTPIPSPMPTPTKPPVQAITSGSFEGENGFWILKEGDTALSFLPFKEFPAPSERKVRFSFPSLKGEEVMAMAASRWEGGTVALLTSQKLSVVVGNAFEFDIPLSRFVPPDRTVRTMELWDFLALIGTDFGLFYYNLASGAQGGISLDGDPSIYEVTSLGIYDDGICLGVTNYTSSPPYRAYWSQDGHDWFPVEFLEPVEAPLAGIWCAGSNKYIAISDEGRWKARGVDLPPNPVSLGEGVKVIQVDFAPGGIPFFALVTSEKHPLFQGSSKGWSSLDSPCQRPLAVIVSEIEGEPLLAVGCPDGIYYRQSLEIEGTWRYVELAK